MKKILSLILVLTILATAGCISGSAARNYDYFDYGNVDLYGGMDIVDVTVLQRHLLNMDVIEPIAEKAAKKWLKDHRFDENSSDYQELLQSENEYFRAVSLEAADYDHSGTVDMVDATFIQRASVKMAIPESCGGYFTNMLRLYSLNPTYASGKAVAGVPVTFTADVKSGTRVNYAFYIDGTEVQNGSENTLTYTFEKAGSYNVYLEVTDAICDFDDTYYDYTVVEPYDLSEPVITNYSFNGRYNPNANAYHPYYPNFYNDTVKAEALGGTAPYTFTFKIELNGTENSPQTAKMYDFRYVEEKPDGQDETVRYIIQDIPGTNEAVLPENFFNDYIFSEPLPGYNDVFGYYNQNNKYEIEVWATDANGVSSEPIKIPFKYVQLIG